MSHQLKASFTRLAFVLVLGAGFAVLGSIARPQVAAAAQACEDDECEAGKTCQDNPDGSTKCAMSGETCQTLGCTWRD